MTTIGARLDAVPVYRFHWKITAIAGLGTFFDLYELFLTGIIVTVLAQSDHLSSDGRSLLVSSVFIGAFIGSTLLAPLSDRFGRRTLLTANIAAYSLLSLAAAFSVNFPMLVALRLLTGIALGTELTLVDTYLSEVIPHAVRGKHIAWAYTIGFFGNPVAAFLGARFVADSSALIAGWRWLLVFGALGGTVVLYARRNLPESPRWLAVHGRMAEAERLVRRIERGAPAKAAPGAQATGQDRKLEGQASAGLRSIFHGEYGKRTIMLTIFQILQVVGYYGFGTLAPLILTSKGFTVTSSLLYSALSFVGYPLGSALSIPLVERIERKYLIMLSALGIAGFGIAFGVATSVPVIVAAGLLLTISSNVMSNAYHTYQAEIFPTVIRGTAVGFSYSWGRASSALLPFIAIAVLDAWGSAAVFAISALLMLVLCLDIGMLGPRSRGLRLEDSGHPSAAAVASRL